MTDYLCPDCGHDASQHRNLLHMDKCDCLKTERQVYESIIATRDQALAEAREALKPFAHEDLRKVLGGNVYGEESIFFQRDKAILRLKDTNRAAEWLKKYP